MSRGHSHEVDLLFRKCDTRFHSWCDFPGAIPREDIIETFKDKSKRSKGKEKGSVNAEDYDIEIV